MATTIELTGITTEIDVVSKYNELIKENLGSSSVYIRTKETLQDFFDSGIIKDSDRANVISQVVSSLNNSLVTSAMNAALAWASKEKDVELNKKEMEYRLALLDKQIETQDKATTTALLDGAIKRAELMKNYGVTVASDGTVTDSVTDGKVDKEIALIAQNTSNAVTEGQVLVLKKDESRAAVHKLIADTYTNYGRFTYTLDDTGVTSVVANNTNDTLAYWQKKIAIEQADGYVFNAWSNAAQSSASMIGTLVTSDLGSTDLETLANNMMSSWSGVVANMTALVPSSQKV